MQNIFAWLGASVTILVLVVAILILTETIIDKLQHMWSCWTWAQRSVEAHKIGQTIIGESYWFGESVEARCALEAIGEALRDGDGIRINEARDVWHRKLSKETGKKEVS